MAALAVLLNEVIVQVQQQLDSLQAEEAEAEQARATGAMPELPTSGSQQALLDTLLPPDVLEGMRDAREEELQVQPSALHCQIMQLKLADVHVSGEDHDKLSA